MPVMIDEHETDPRSVLDLRGSRLDTVIDPDAEQGRMLHLFTNRNTAVEYLMSVVADPSQGNQPKTLTEKQSLQSLDAVSAFAVATAAATGMIELYVDAWWGKPSWRLSEFLHVLKTAGSNGWRNYHTLVAGWTLAYKQVTCIDSNLALAKHVTFAEGLNGAGDWLLPHGGGKFFIEDLTRFGWNDRIASHKLWFTNEFPV